MFRSLIHCARTAALLITAAGLAGSAIAQPATQVEMPSSSLIVAEGTPALLAVRLAPGSTAHSARVEIRDAQDQVVGTRDFSDLAPDAAGFLPLSIALDEPGYYGLSVTLDRSTTSVQSSAVVLPPAIEPVPGEELRFGVYAHGSTEQIESVRAAGYYRLMGKLGAGWATTDLWWRDVQPDGPEQWDWTIADRRFADLKAAGITPIPHLFGIPQWASSHREDDAGGADGLSFHVYPPSDWDAWARFVEAFVTRYGADMKYLRIWNEPDSQYWMGTPEEFARLLKIAYETAHRVKPDIQILIDTALAKMSYFEALEQSGGGPYFDILSIHNYQLEKVLPPEQTMFGEGYTAAAAWRDRVRPGIPLWESEVCWLAEPWSDPSWYGQGELDQARYLVRGAMLALGAGVEKVIWFPFHSWRWEENGKPFQHSGGLVRADCSPRPAFAAYHTLSNLLGTATPAGKLDLPSQTAHALTFARGEESVTVLWSTEASGEWITLAVGDDTPRAIGLFGEEQELAAREGKLTLQLGQSPLYLRTARKPAVVGDAWQVDAWRISGSAEVSTGSGEGAPYTVQIANPSSGPRLGLLRLEGPGNLVSQQERILLGADGSTSMTLRLPTALVVGAGADEHVAGRLVLTDVSGAEQPIPVRLPARRAAEPLWRAAQPADRSEFMREVAHPGPVEALSFTFPAGVAYDVELEVRKRESSGWERIDRRVAQGVYHVPVGRTIDAYRLVFRQLVSDPGFELDADLPKQRTNPQGSDWWNAISRPYISLATDTPHSGARYVDIQSTGRSKTDPWSNVQQWIPVKPNTEYSFTAYGRFKSTHDAWAALYVTGLERLLPHSFAVFPYIDDTWHRMYLTVRTEPGQTRLRVSCAIVGDGHFMYDDVMAIEGRVPTDIPELIDATVHLASPVSMPKEEDVIP